MRTFGRSASIATGVVIALAVGMLGRVQDAAAQSPVTVWQLPAAPVPAMVERVPARSCQSLAANTLPLNAIVRDARVMPDESGAGGWCRVTIEASDGITVWVALPLEHWNGRFLGLGGGGWVAGFPVALELGVPLGFA